MPATFSVVAGTAPWKALGRPAIAAPGAKRKPRGDTLRFLLFLFLGTLFLRTFVIAPFSASVAPAVTVPVPASSARTAV